MIFFSIIVPIYNTNIEYLNHCIYSIRQQKYANFEVIYIDDCSTDEITINFLRKLKCNKKEKIIWHKQNFGLGESRNTGIINSRGDYIIFLDSDDWITKNMLIKMNQSILKNQDHDIFNINFKYVYQNKIINNPQPYNELTSMSWSLIIKKDFLIKNNIYFAKENIKHEDELFLLKLLFYKPCIFYVNEFLYYYNKNNNESITYALKTNESLLCMNKNLKIFLDEIPNNCFNSMLSARVLDFVGMLPFYFIRKDKSIKLHFFLKNTIYFSKLISLVKKKDINKNRLLTFYIIKLIYNKCLLFIFFLFFKYIYLYIRKTK